MSTPDLAAAARELRTAAGSGSSDPAPNYVKVDPNVVLLLADLLGLMHGWQPDNPASQQTVRAAEALAAAILGGDDHA